MRFSSWFTIFVIDFLTVRNNRKTNNSFRSFDSLFPCKTYIIYCSLPIHYVSNSANLRHICDNLLH